MVWHGRLCSGAILPQVRKQCLRKLGSSAVHAPQPVPKFQSEAAKLKLSDLRGVVGMKDISEELMSGLVSDNQDLTTAATHLFAGEGKYFRPTCVMLMGECCNHGNPSNHSQREIALITELIHVASLVHDDVLDEAVMRRSLLTVNALYNDKVAMLTGDYIIALATHKLARLGCSRTITVLSSVIRDLIKGEIHQLKGGSTQDSVMSSYLDKSYHKTASLLAHGCQAVVLNSPNPHLQQHAFNYGKYLGITFQLIDDLLDYVSSSETLGKGAGSDLAGGLATAPVLYAAAAYPQLHAAIERGFSGPGDVERALEMVHSSGGLERTRELAELYTGRALRELEPLPDCSYKTGLVALCDVVLNRSS